jgi:uncharacterized Fe-S radical SAM superfamily protein PflX
MMAKRMTQSTDFKRNNKVALRNFTEPNDIHDVIKTLLVRIIRRKYSNNNRVPIYTEYNPKYPNENYPDIWMRLPEQKIVVYEIQRKMSKQWIDKMNEQYEEVEWNLIKIDKIEKEWVEKLKKSPKDPIGKLTKILEKEII